MWAALIFIIIAVFMVVSSVGDFWQSAPDWLRISPSTTITTKLLGAACAVFAVISVYFFAASRREAP
jgi:divalent metal cation (Fe/Co/Zn/Cd) transporter